MTQKDNSEGRIVTRTEGHVRIIGFDRPAKYNGFSLTMFDQLSQALTDFEADPEARVGLIYGEGKHTTAGLDLPTMTDRLSSGTGSLVAPGQVDPFDNFPPKRSKPLVMAVQGISFTIAIEMMLACDIVIAADDCRFAQMEVRRGIMPSCGGTMRMIERAGWGNAMRWLLTGAEFDSATALRLGFVQEVVPAGQQFDRALALAQEIAAQAPLAVQALIHHSRLYVAAGYPAAVADFAPTQRRLFATADAQEGLESFKERRTANFTGR
jgi:enoyl-CoA hydratase